MASLPIYLAVLRPAPSQRVHFRILILVEVDAPKQSETRSDACRGIIIHVVGDSISGFSHQFKRNCNTAINNPLLIWTPTYAYAVEEHTARRELNNLALRMDPPRVSANFLAPVDNISSS